MLKAVIILVIFKKSIGKYNKKSDAFSYVNHLETSELFTNHKLLALQIGAASYVRGVANFFVKSRMSQFVGRTTEAENRA